MSFSLKNAIVYDCEVLPNIFTFAMEMLNSDTRAVWEMSEWRDDRRELVQFFQWLSNTQTPMIGYNNVGYDYPIIHELWKNPNISFQALRAKSDLIIEGGDRFGNMVWASDRFAPQIDLYKLNHLDNRAKSTGLKTLQINMRSPNVVEADIPFDQPVPFEKRDTTLVPYNQHDVGETKRFAHFNKAAIDFRISLIEQFGVDVLNWNDTKIGEQMVIQRLGDDLCYDRSSGKRETRKTLRTSIALKNIIFPYVQFQHPEFNRVLNYMKAQVLKADDWKTDEDGTPIIKTKGVFTDLTATINGFTFHYGVGGIHGSVERKRVESGNGYIVRDIDVKALYPSIAVQNNLAPEHLGSAFVGVYSQLPKERERWQQEKGKKCVEANALKLASNGVYGKSNSIFSPFYDPAFMLQITVNGQLMLSMLAERLMQVTSLSLVQINTDGITYHVHESQLPQCQQIEKEWQKLTGLVLEDALYQKMFIRDVNAYLAVGIDGSVKLKGTYWAPTPLEYHQSIAESQPPSWHKSFNNIVSTRAAVSHMLYGTDIEQFIRLTTNPYDFCCAVKIKRSDTLLWGGVPQQRNTRFFVSTSGAGLVKQLPAQGTPGAFKKANGVTDAYYAQVMAETGGAWDVRVCTKNQSRYEERESQVMAGHTVIVCNNINDFDWSKVNYDWYVQEALKLVI